MIRAGVEAGRLQPGRDDRLAQGGVEVVQQPVVELVAHEQLVGAVRVPSLRGPDGVRVHDDRPRASCLGPAPWSGSGTFSGALAASMIAPAGQRDHLQARHRPERRVDRLLHRGLRRLASAAARPRSAAGVVSSMSRARLRPSFREPLGREIRRHALGHRAGGIDDDDLALDLRRSLRHVARQEVDEDRR